MYEQESLNLYGFGMINATAIITIFIPNLIKQNYFFQRLHPLKVFKGNKDRNRWRFRNLYKPPVMNFGKVFPTWHSGKPKKIPSFVPLPTLERLLTFIFIYGFLQRLSSLGELSERVNTQAK